MCDIQIVAGLSILASAFILGPQCGLDAYHWQMIVHLAWFSAVTHLSGLFALRGYVVSRRWTKYGRLGFMFILMIMLLVATFPTLFFDWREDWRDSWEEINDWPRIITMARQNSRAVCFFNINYVIQLRNHLVAGPFISRHLMENSHQFQAVVFSMFLLAFGFVSRLVKLSGPLSRTFSVLIREPLSAMGQKLLRKSMSCQPLCLPSSLWHNAMQQPALASFIMIRVFTELISSMLAEVSTETQLPLPGTIMI